MKSPSQTVCAAKQNTDTRTLVLWWWFEQINKQFGGSHLGNKLIIWLLPTLLFNCLKLVRMYSCREIRRGHQTYRIRSVMYEFHQETSPVDDRQTDTNQEIKTRWLCFHRDLSHRIIESLWIIWGVYNILASRERWSFVDLDVVVACIPGSKIPRCWNSRLM